MFLFGRYLAGLADVPQIVLVTVGVLLIAVELFLAPGTLWFAAAGVVLALGGLIWANVGSELSVGDPLGRMLLVDSTLWTLVTAALALAAMYAVSRFLPKTPVFNRLVLDGPAGLGTLHGAAAGRAASGPANGAGAPSRPTVGAEGRALTDLRPVGKVALDASPDSEHEARASGRAIETGARVRVVELQGSRLVVEELAGDEVARP